MSIKSLAVFLSFSVVLIACKKDDPPEEFDRGAMLTNMATAVIKPQLNTCSNKLNDLHTAAQNFVATPDAGALAILKTNFTDAYVSFELIKMFDFGPMMTYAIKASMNTYPTDTSQIQANISSGSYILTALENVPAIGFPSLDYLLYHASETAVIDEFTVGVNASNRKIYLTDITSKMKTEFALMLSAWVNYEAEFVTADGNDVGGSTSILFNEWLKDIELLKNAKIGIPAGQQTGGLTLPHYTEGYYSQISIELAKANVAGLKNVFLGAAGIGFDDYIIDVEAEGTTVSLADNIIAQFDLVTQKLDAIGNPLSDKVDTNPSGVNDAYLEIKKLLTYCKTDVSSILGLLITFQDNDGD